MVNALLGRRMAALVLALVGWLLVALPARGAEAGGEAAAATQAAAPRKIRALVLTGGHAFDEKAFPKLLEAEEGEAGDIEFTTVRLKDESEVFEDVSDWKYDVIVLYSMTQKISEKRQKNFLGLLDKGVGIVALHHNAGAFGEWATYQKIIGVKYRHRPETVEGKMRPASTYHEGVDIHVQVADTEHFITRGMPQTFTVHDEVYGKQGFEPDNHILLTNDHPESDRAVVWTRSFGHARVCTIQLGHGPEIFTRPEYRGMVHRAVRWVARPARVVVVTGLDYPGHKWQETAPLLAKLLGQDPRLQVTVVEKPEFLAEPGLFEYDVLVLHYMNWEKPDPGDKARENLQKFVAGGRGLVLVHFACGAFQGWPEFAKIAGRVWDPKARPHDPYGEFTVKIARPEDPIVAGMKDFATTDELYTCLVGEAPITVLAEAESKVDQKVYPMAFTCWYGGEAGGKVFHCVLGHDVKSYNAAVGELYRRGTEWAAGR